MIWFTNKILIVFILFFTLSLVLVGCNGCSRYKINERVKKNTINHVEPAFESKEHLVKKTAELPFSKSENLSLQELFKKYKSAVFLITTSDGQKTWQGSGFFITPEGVGLSNYHVFEGTNKGLETIKLESGQEFKISEVIAASKEKDFILFKVELSRTTNYFNIASSPSEIGDQVFAIGNPKGLDHTLSTGIISGYRENDLFIQTTTEITHGSSGGPLINMDGEVIGITTAGLGEANLNFAVNMFAILEE